MAMSLSYGSSQRPQSAIVANDTDLLGISGRPIASVPSASAVTPHEQVGSYTRVTFGGRWGYVLTETLRPAQKPAEFGMLNSEQMSESRTSLTKLFPRLVHSAALLSALSLMLCLFVTVEPMLSPAWLALQKLIASVHLAESSAIVAIWFGSIASAIFVQRRTLYVGRGTRSGSTGNLALLPNRALFTELLEQALSGARKTGRGVVVLFLDLDRFKVFNDTMGHQAGDKLLLEVGKRLHRVTGSHNTVVRLGGDEFAVLAQDLEDLGRGEAIAREILEGLAGALVIDGHSVFVSASIGVSGAISGDCPADELCRRADIALYQAKADGRARYKVFQGERQDFSIERLELDTALRSALRQDELELYYQPEVDLATGRVTGYEALLRWRHSTRGLLLPGDFLAAAEEAGLMPGIDRWVLGKACGEAAHWMAKGYLGNGATISVNVAPSELLQPDFVDHVARVLSDTGLPSSRLKLEILETGLLVEEEAGKTLAALRELGIKIAIDDFGAGHSSLDYLRKFDVDTIKIDRQLVVGAAQDKRIAAVIRCITSMARVLEIDVVAEGVETEEQLALVTEAGCDRAQGYFFAKPMFSGAVARFSVSRQDIEGTDEELAIAA